MEFASAFLERRKLINMYQGALVSGSQTFWSTLTN